MFAFTDTTALVSYYPKKGKKCCVAPDKAPAAAATVREIQERTAPSTTPVSEVAAEGKGKRKRCQVCRPSDDVKTSMTCVKCAKFICKKQSVMTCHSYAV
ncbi:hypothetical protein AMECASPLE_037482 [Ameca splendens]|uniref:PiggyBac transposable element-derived protein 4 C-terminal zinc-ribbon domain-containing protein n=1 Tax=Ameca splendens TaxID=208324 RepID=A0ABV0ZTJ4_9TELE